MAATRRLAHHLRSLHDAACVAQGLRAWQTPDVVTWPELLQRQFRADREAGRTCARWLPESHARLAWEQIVRSDEAVASVLAPAGLGATAHRSWTLLNEYLVPDAALAQADSAEAVAFGHWVHRYRQFLRQGGWIDPALAAATVGPWDPGLVLRFAGFERLTPAQVACCGRMRAQGVTLAGLPALESDAAPEPDLEVVDCNDFDAELETAARWAAARLLAEPRSRLALVVPSLARERGRVRRALDRVLVPEASVTNGPAPESRAYELAAARPLDRHVVVATALAWLDAALGRLDLVGLSSLLLGTHDGSAGTESLARAALDVELRRSGVPVRGLGAAADEARRRGCTATAEMLGRLARRGATWFTPHLPSHWSLEFARALREIGWPGEGATSAEFQAVERWQALLVEFGASDDVAGLLSPAAAHDAVRALASVTAFEPQDIAAPLLVIDPDTVRGMRFDAVWICGLDAARWPPPASPDPFLPREWQLRQGMPGASAELAEVEARRTLGALASSAPAVICSIPRFEGEAPLLPSAFVADRPRSQHVAAWPGIDATQALFDARPALQIVEDGVLPAFATHAVVRGGARLLELQAACPFRAAVELRLGGRPLEDPAVGIAPTERGKLVHAVLQRFWEETRSQAALKAMRTDEIAARVAAYADGAIAPLRAGADDVRARLLGLEQRWVEARVRELLEQDLAREDFTVEHLETPRVVDLGGVQVRVVLDRVDRLSDGTLAFIDYKTGVNARPASWRGERPALPQLPLYTCTVPAHEVGAVAFGVVRRGGTGYAGYVRAPGVFAALDPFVAGRAPFKEDADWLGMLGQWHGRLDALAQEHAAGVARLAPDPTRACRHCHLPGLCRSAQAFLEVEAVGEAADAGE